MPTSVLARWGNSLALRVPKEAACHFKEGDHFEIVADDAGLHFKKARQVKKYGIEDVLETLPKEENKELDWGSPAGEEIW